MTDCVRTYSTDYGLDQIAGIAARHGLKVMQGLWLSSHPDKNRDADRNGGGARQPLSGHHPRRGGRQRGAVARRNVGGRPRRHHARGQGAGAGAGDLCRRLGVLAAQSARSRRPPISSPSISCLIGRTSRSPAREAAAHVDAIRRRVVAAFPGKEVLIGEVGWPSAGRMREGALPSPANQARVIQDVLALAARENFRVNVIEAYRPAMEARARRHGRRPLGPDRATARASSNSSGARRCPIIRCGAGRRRAAWRSALIVFGAAFAARRERGAAMRFGSR